MCFVGLIEKEGIEADEVVHYRRCRTGVGKNKPNRHKALWAHTTPCGER
jgi:hypothetical protein